MLKDFEPANCQENSNHFECLVANYMKRFTLLLHMFFCLALVITVIIALYMFFSEISNIFGGGDLSTAAIHSLGSLLILWTLSELLNSEIRHLRGEKIKTTIFIEVAIAAIVRKLLILSSEGLTLQDGSIFLATLLVLGIVHWCLQSRSNRI
ncbi:MAG: phosphate-starvation-inducible PsiE family protein [Sporomusaceae bacterium]|nr:phosphate-starvation-inducible PsiE family protein [Sporomusaceae bacterium]